MSSPDVVAAPFRLKPWQVVLVVVWLLAFTGFFFSFALPNNPDYHRLDILIEMPFLYLDLIDPPDDLQRDDSGVRYLVQRGDVVLCAAAIIVAAWGLGHLLLRWVEPPLPARCLERTLLACGLGLSAWSLLTLDAGYFGFLSRWLFLALMSLAVLVELLLRWRERKTEPLCSLPPLVRGEWCTVLVMLPFLLAMLLGAMLPSFDFDVKEYHLQGPKEYWQQGRITMLPHNVYTSFPFLTEMLTLQGMVVRGDWYRGALVGKAVLCFFAPLTALGLFAAGRRWFSPLVGWLAALVFLSAPWVYRISIIAYTEGGLACYLFLAALAIGLGIEQLKRQQPATRFWLLAGLLAGSGMACKYPGLVSVVFPLAAVAAGLTWKHTEKSPGRAALRALLVFTAGTVLAVGPWLVKNSIETRNPVYPLAYSVFGGDHWDEAMNEKWKAAHSPDHHHPSDLLVKFVDVTAKSDWLSPLLYLFAPLAFLWSDRRKIVGGLWLFVGYLFLTWWVLTHRIDRFWVPMIPVVALLAGAGLERLWNCEPPGLRWLSRGLVAITLAFNFIFISTPLCGFNGWLMDYEAARESAGQTAPGIHHLNKTLPDGAKVLCVGEAQVFDARFPVVYNTVFDDSIFQQWVARELVGVEVEDYPLKPAAEIREKFTEEHITHVLVNWQEILRYRRTYGYTPFVTPRRFGQLRAMNILKQPTPTGYRPLKNMSPEDVAEVRRWAPGLVQELNGEEVFVTGEVYEVLPPVAQ